MSLQIERGRGEAKNYHPPQVTSAAARSDFAETEQDIRENREGQLLTMRQPARTPKDKAISAASAVVTAADSRNGSDSRRSWQVGGPEPPRALAAHGQRLWDAIQAEYRIADAAGVELLAQACAGLDRAEALAAEIARVGFVLTGGRANPLVKDELAARAFVVKTLSRLGLDLEPSKPVGRPLTGGMGARRDAS
jgi:hypothetical protein